MKENARTGSIRIDLNQFKLHIDLKKRIELTLHFNSPSRRFYFSLIAFVVNEMKRLEKITSIPLEGHHDLLALLNESVGGSAGSSNEENLLPRIYRKWKDALPNLEEAPLFKVLGKRKKYDEGDGKTYPFTDSEKDNWANLFEYIGSNENVRLKFAIDKIGLNLRDVDIVYEDSINGDAWDRFLLSLKTEVEKTGEAKPIQSISEIHEPPVSLPSQQGTGLRRRYGWVVLIAMVVMIAGAGTWAIWEFTSQPSLTKKASMDRMAFPLPEKPSIAVLPFVNLSGDPSQEVLADGITNSIITTFSSNPYLFVIARNSSFAYKGKPVKIQQVAEELGVRYVIEGSVARSGDRIRLSAQLVDAIKGHHLWGERYDWELKDLFALQDELARRIRRAVGVKLTHGEQFLHQVGPKNIEVLMKFYQAVEYIRAFNIDDNNRARLIAEECIVLESDWYANYHLLGSVSMTDIFLGNTKDPAVSLQTAIELLEKAIDMTEVYKERIYPQLGYLYSLKRDYDKAIELGEKGVAAVPNGSEAHAWLAMSLTFAGRAQEAIPRMEKAIRLDPLPPAFYYQNLGSAYSRVGRTDEAIAMYKNAIALTPNNVMAYAALAAAYVNLDREDEAKAAAAQVLRINPKFSAKRYAYSLAYKDQSISARFMELMIKAGLPE